MAKPRSAIEVVLIQVREHREAAEQERAAFLARCRLRPEQLRILDVVLHPEIRFRDVENADAVMIGGSGSHSVTVRYPFTEPLAEVVRELVERDRPFFGSCWGHQFLGEVLGGRVETDEAASEVGTFDAFLTETGRRDPLTAELPERFAIQLGHKDHITRAPTDLETLASSERCPRQLVRVAGKPAYGSQFHSEMSIADMKARVRIYQSYVPGGAEEVARFDAALRPSPEADGLLDRFLSLYT